MAHKQLPGPWRSHVCAMPPGACPAPLRTTHVRAAPGSANVPVLAESRRDLCSPLRLQGQEASPLAEWTELENGCICCSAKNDMVKGDA